jgi:hypothetical protein
MMVQAVASTASPVPKGFRAAVSSPDSADWWQAMNSEISQMQRRQVFTAVDSVPVDQHGRTQQILSTIWVYTAKQSSAGDEVKKKARLCCRGDMQSTDLPPWMVYASVVKFGTFRMLVALAVQLGLYTRSLDVSGAYLYAPLAEPVYIHSPPGFRSLGKYLRLNKAVYGLRQSARAWADLLAQFLQEYGLQRCFQDDCVYISHPGAATHPPDAETTRPLPSDGLFICTVTVDDIACFYQHERDFDRFYRVFAARFEHTDRGFIDSHIGFQFQGRTDQGRVKLSAARLIDDILREQGMEACNPCYTPAEIQFFTPNTGQPQLTKEYQSVIGKLNWLVLTCRPDIANCVRALSSHQKNPGAAHWQGIKRLLRYLKASRDVGIVYERHKSLSSACDSLGPLPSVTAVCDSDFANEQDRVSVSGWLVGFAGANPAAHDDSPVDVVNVFDWSSKKQSDQGPAYSTTEAEAYSLAETIRLVQFYRKFIAEVGFAPQVPTSIFVDNSPLVVGINSGARVKGLKHIELRNEIIDYRINKGIVQLVHVPGNKNPADALTKPLPRPHFQWCRNWWME